MRVSLVGAVDAQARKVAARSAEIAHVKAERLARGRQCMQSRNAGGVVDHTEKALGQAQRVAQPFERDFFDFGRRRRGPPQHPVDVERRRQQLGEHGRLRASDGEVGEETRMVPVRDARDHDALEVVEQGVEVLALLRHRGRHRGGDFARAHLREHGEIARALEIARDPRGSALQRCGEFTFVHDGGCRHARRARRSAPAPESSLRLNRQFCSGFLRPAESPWCGDRRSSFP